MIFFKVGFNPQYTDDILVYDETINEVQHFNPIGSKEVVKRILKPPSDVEVLMRGSLYENYVRALGRFIIWKHKWGFVMNLLSYSIVREGKISPFWTVILQQPYFIEIFRRYQNHASMLGMHFTCWTLMSQPESTLSRTRLMSLCRLTSTLRSRSSNIRNRKSVGC
jgi:hypothetical protein